MTDKTDLTENRDFRGPSKILIDRILADEVLELAEERAMSTDEFEKVYAWEQLFKPRHYSEHLDVFRDESIWKQKMESHCQRCGKEFRLPWKKVYDLCIECDSIYLNRIPWKEIVPVRDRGESMGIFNLR